MDGWMDEWKRNRGSEMDAWTQEYAPLCGSCFCILVHGLCLLDGTGTDSGSGCGAKLNIEGRDLAQARLAEGMVDGSLWWRHMLVSERWPHGTRPATSAPSEARNAG